MLFPSTALSNYIHEYLLIKKKTGISAHTGNAVLKVIFLRESYWFDYVIYVSGEQGFVYVSIRDWKRTTLMSRSYNAKFIWNFSNDLNKDIRFCRCRWVEK